jgi:hypothetical protein
MNHNPARIPQTTLRCSIGWSDSHPTIVNRQQPWQRCTLNSARWREGIYIGPHPDVRWETQAAQYTRQTLDAGVLSYLKNSKEASITSETTGCSDNVPPVDIPLVTLNPPAYLDW